MITLLRYKFVVLFCVLFPNNKTVIRRTSTRRHKASLQRHLGVPQAQGNLSLQAALAHPVRRKETVEVSVSGHKGMTRGMTAERESEAVAHRLSWDPWLSTSAGLPLSIINKEQSRQRCDRSSVVSFHGKAPTPLLIQIIATG